MGSKYTTVEPAHPVVARVSIIASPALSEHLGPLFSKAGLEHARTAVPGDVDCVVIVHAPPELDAVARLGTRADGMFAPTVVLTQGRGPSERRALLRAGATEVLAQEGLDGPALAAAVEDAMARAAAMHERTPDRDAAGPPTGAVAAPTDMSALAQAEARRDESEAQFQALADNIAQLAWMTDETGYIHWYNRRWFDFTGTTLEEMKGWGWQKVHHPDHLARVVEKFRRHVASGEPWEDTFPLRGADRRYRWFLSRAFPLRDRTGKIVSWFGTNTDITAQREAEEALREADRRKDEFIAILAHELRNPLAPVRSSVEILKRVGPPEPRLQRAREVIERQVTHMARLVDDLLDVSRLSRGTLSIAKEPCDLAAVAVQTAEDYRSSFEANGVELCVLSPSTHAWVEGDAVRLAQMIGNLLNNAGRFTERGGRVEVHTEVRGPLAEVRVTDTGAGMDAALLSRLFKPFHQAEQGLARSKGGLGLGLALTKGLAELHGGGVEAASDGLGRGSTFRLHIPVHRGARDVLRDGPRAPGGESLRILVVEDNRDAAETLADVLRLEGHEAEIAFDGEKGLDLAATFQPEVVISDLGLPGRFDGYELARALRAAPRRPLLVALSGYASDDDRRRARDAGFDTHLPKPPNLEELAQLLRLRRG